MNFSGSKLQFALLISIAAILSALIAIFLSAQTEPFSFEVSMRSSQLGNAQVFYDLGSGMNERDSVRRPFRASESAATHRFPLPPGEYKAIRLDPIEHGNDTSITIYRLGILDSSGRVVRHFSPEEFTAYHDVSEKQLTGGTITLKLAGTDIDPNLTINLAQPLVLRLSAATFWRSAGRFFCYWFFPLGAAGVLWLWLVPKLEAENLQRKWTRLVSWSPFW